VTTNEKAPAGQGRGKTESRGDDHNMLTLEQATDDIDDIVALRKNYQPTPTEVDAAEKLQGYEVRIRYNAPVEEDTELHGRSYRWAGVLEVVPRIQAITIRLAPGAQESDLVFMQWNVRRLLAGYWNALELSEKRSPADGSTWWRTTLAYSARPGLGGYIVPCTVLACTDHGQHHVADVSGEVWHESEVTEHRDGWYRIKAVRRGDEEWKLCVDVDEDLDARAASDLTNDLVWTRATISKLNEGASSEGPTKQEA
jgi:hypothetical protein